MQPFATKNIAIVCNPFAGVGKAVELTKKIAETLLYKNITHHIFNKFWPTNFNQFTHIFIVGGDGTLNYFINKYINIKLPLVIFNGGTGNDFHWLLYGKQSFNQQLQTALSKDAKPIDVGKCNNHFFINGVGIGFEGEVVKALTGKKKIPGKTSFLITIIKKIFSYRSKNYTITSPENNITGKKLLVDIANGARAGGGFYISPKSKADDGWLNVVIVNNLSLLKRLLHFPVIEKGKHLHFPFVTHYCTKKIIIKSNTILQYHLDGEYFEDTQLDIEILKGKLNFIY